MDSRCNAALKVRYLRYLQATILRYGLDHHQVNNIATKARTVNSGTESWRFKGVKVVVRVEAEVHIVKKYWGGFAE